MTATQAPPLPFGRHLGAAARAARTLLDDVLAGEAMTYETWIALNLLATSGSRVGREEFAQILAAGLQPANDSVIAQLLGQLEAFGLVRTTGAGEDRHIEMTPAGEIHFQRVLAAVNARSARALAGVDPADVQTTIRVLGQFQAGAQFTS